MPNKYFSTTSCLLFRLQQIVEEVGYKKTRPIHVEKGEG